MKLETFFEKFELFAEAPNGVQKLRELILQLAVQGKLVPQDPSDEPASVLLEKIQFEKSQLIKDKKVRKADVSTLTFGNDDVPYELPSGWKWAYLEQISNLIHYGYTASANPNIADVRLLRITDIQNNKVNWERVPGCDIDKSQLESYQLNDGDLLIARTGGTIGKSYLVKNLSVCAVFASYLIRVIPNFLLLPKYLKLFFESGLYWQQLYAKSMGTGQPNVNGTSLKSLIVPLPPHNEQHRIVAKVDQLMSLCDELEERQKKKRETRVLLNNVTISQLLTAREPDTFAKHWQCICNNFDLLYSAPENIGKLRQAILQLAVMGKLVPQDSSDEPASVLLNKIRFEKELLIQEGKIKKEKPLSSIKIHEMSFNLPKHWEWVRMQTIFTVITDGDHQPPPKTESGVPFLVISNVRTGFLDFTASRYVSEEYYLSIDKIRKPCKGDILYTVVGSYGIPVIVDTEKCFCVQRHIAILKPSKYLETVYLKHLLNSELVFSQSTKCATGIAQKTVPLNGLRNIVVPLPPLEEQKRIASKIEQLVSFCNKLEIELDKSQIKSAKLIATAVDQLLIM